MVQPATPAMLPALKHLWQTCFGDTAQYIDFIFASLLHPSQMLVIADDADRPLAMLHWKLLRFRCGDQSCIGAYVFGVATDPACRGKGLSTELMDALHRRLPEHGAALSALVPASESLFAFYGARGYTTAFQVQHVRLRAEQIPPNASGGVLTVGALEDLEPLRNSFYTGSRLFAAWDRDYLRFSGGECRLLGGEVLRYSAHGRKGYAVCYPSADALLVKELAVHERELDGLLLALHRRYGKRRYDLRLPADYPSPYPGNILPFGMVQWYDKKAEQQAASAAGSAPWLAYVLD